MTNKYTVNIILLSFFLIISSSCSEKKKEIKLKKEKTKVGSVYAMLPFENNLPKINKTEEKRLQNTIQEFYKKVYIPNNFSGSMLVAKNGHIIYESYRGMSNFEEKKPITAETPIHIASLSKVLTATAIMLLIDSKQIKLDQKVNTILDDLPYEDVTVRTLLNHRSGIRNYSYFTDKSSEWSKRDTLRNSDLIPFINKFNVNLEFKTNSRFSYCNTNYALLALIIEKVTKMDYRTAMKELIFEPLDMKNTFVFDLKKDSKTASHSYKGNKIRYAYNYLDDIYGDKNIYSTPRDILKFDMATYSPSFLNKELLSEIFKGYSYESKGTRNYGLGIRLFEWEDGKKMFYHNGWWHGNTSAYIKLKDEKATLICLSNKYTRCTYRLKLLSSLFGNYPFEIKSREESLE
ncbi:serine hydrolase domain-containing protein [Flavobacterium terrae]|uniref:CubicO group peptidase, beta-lactamase class C family n=1 Tax=Flavobacterium terrae TaxID=415425 RepID=A0A1M6GEY1_9FLAO|nr:serine hydrolase domain-containing protein [Flavobacterium terrae]SHJ08515.1 CubicO group peptidase, beta-lactamase class C family [Flavobacterium terrae]